MELQELRNEINRIDGEMLALLERRLAVCRAIAEYKRQNGLPVRDPARETEKTEWQLWDGPWEYEGLTEEQKKENLQKYIKALEEWAAICESLSDEMPRKSFQICTPEGEYVGWCGSYFINEDCCIDENGDRLAIGIDLPEENARGKGLATHALRLFMAYLHSLGFTELYTQTWSGNERMIGLAEKLGFTECCRKPGLRTVRGQQYDGLTFRKEL